MELRVLHISLAVALALFTLLASVSTASADLLVGSPGSGAGQYESPQGVAVDTSTAEPSSGHVYVADTGNSRVDVFDSSGAFLFAFGWKVNATTPEEKLQTCTIVTGCQKGTSGGGAGQLKSPEGIAVDPSSHAVYVAEESNHRVQKFDSEGHFLLMFGKGVNTGTSGKADLCTNAGAPTDVCGGGMAGGGLGQFNEGVFPFRVSIGPGGAVYVADSKNEGGCEIPGIGGSKFKKRVQKFNAAGEVLEAVEPSDAPCGGLQGLAVASTGDFYLANAGGTGAVRKYHPDGTFYGAPYPLDPSGSIVALGVDTADNLFVADREDGIHVILEYNSSGTQLRAFYGSGSLKNSVSVNSLAPFHTANGDVFVSQSSGVVHIPFPPPGPLVLPGFTEATAIGNSRATLKASVNPEGKATEFAFQYVDEATFQADVAAEGPGHGFDHAQTSTFEAIPGPGGSSFQQQSVSKQLPLASLAPETTYHFRAVARSADAPAGNPGEEGTPFTTLGPPEVLDTWATEVGSDTARLHAEVDPLLLATTGYFQYVDDATYEADVEALGVGHGFDHAATSPDVNGGSAQLDFGSGEGGFVRSALAQPLSPGTTYHFRLIAEDPFAHQIPGPERLLRTFALSGANDTECPNQAFRTGTSAALPDCRAYEMVSPLDKNNGDVFTRINITGFPTELNQSSLDGAGFTYSSYRAFADPQSAPYTNQLLANRDPEQGWQSEAIVPARGPLFRSGELEDPYKAFSADLSQAWMLQEGPPTLDPCAPAGFADLYRRDSATGAFEALSCAQPNLGSNVFMPELSGFSADGSVAVFRVDDDLAVSGGPPSSGLGNYQVYISSGGGELRMVSVLPNGEASGANSSAGTALRSETGNHNRFGIVDGAVSEDGSRVFWSTGTGGSGPIYLRQNPTSEQSASGACDEAGKACTIPVSGSDPAYFQTANPEGTKALFKVSGGPFAGNLYEFDVEEEARQLIAEGVLDNILGASEDLAQVYFASTKASAQAQAEGAVAGKPNVYLTEGGESRFVGKLGSADLPAGNLYGSPIGTAPIERTARVSADGSGLVFMSFSKELSELTAGYDNTDAKSGQADAEVYLYDADADGGAGKLRCVSCNPSGARPIGGEIEQGENGGIGPWAAATLPRFQTQFLQSRYLSDAGDRVFFNSFEALVLADTNGKQDVYQWEAPGTGRCTAESPSYLPASEGCLSLISSGQSSDDSRFLDANVSGSDVFFTTAEDLLPQDYGLVDVYDARVNGGLPPPPAPPPACEGDACQSPVVPPNDPTPASSSFEGAADPNPRRSSSSRCPAGKRKARKAGRSRCVRVQRAKSKHRKQANGHRRAAQ
jgi:DNA-binding beta-propeller fold protein YncE